MKKVFATVVALMMILCAACCAEARVDALTYAVFPYLPDSGYYQQIIEHRWAEVEPEIPLVRAEWDCYTDGAPEGIDVVMFDAVMLESLVDVGWIQPIDPYAVLDSGDIFPFAVEGLTVEESLYGIPVFLCGNFLIYDVDSAALDTAEHITDLADMSEILVVNSENPANRSQYIIEAIADTRGAANPSVDGGAEDAMELIDRLTIDAHKHDDDAQVAMAYDAGIGQGYIGFSESVRFLKNRADRTRIKSISFSGQPDVRRLYVDAAAVTADVEGQRFEKCLELMNIMAGADMLTALSVQDGAPQYLLLARRSPYPYLSEAFPIYAQLESLAGAENNHVILTP